MNNKKQNKKVANFITVKQAAKTFNKHPNTIRRWIKQGKINAVKMFGKFGAYLIYRDSLLEHIILEEE